ncbi:GIY-YIG nuclease family protein [Rufibacter tibetensis]|nr:GIY-YIG nuclease family protein [Rufibacter tibetensis]
MRRTAPISYANQAYSNGEFVKGAAGGRSTSYAANQYRELSKKMGVRSRYMGSIFVEHSIYAYLKGATKKRYMRLEDFSTYSREEVLRNFKEFRYVRDNQSYFLYLIFTAGACVYVGETSNIFWRIVKHRDKCADDSIIYLQEYPDKDVVLKLEKHYIRVLKPMFNSRYCQAGQLELFRL